jgi:putative radical SAM enzyme (TIGR03279 family)
LYVSVHATDPALRKYLLQSQIPDDLLGNMRRLVDGGIQLHTQVVLIPGINDGKNLEHTLHDLRQFYPSVMSVSIVPVGLTDHRKGLPQLRSVDGAYAAEALAHVEQIQQKNKSEIGVPFCFLGDEFYIKAGHPIPPRSHYGDFPLVENGVGMIRNFLDEFSETMSLDWTRPRGLPVRATVVTGVLFYPILKECVDRMNTKFQIDLRCLPVENRFLGKGITVAGLLGGSDIYASVQNQMYGDCLILPSECMTGEEGLFLDDWVQTDLETRLQKPALRGGHHVADFFKLVFSDRQIC